MAGNEPTRTHDCKAGCPHCRVAGEQHGGLSGWRLVLAVLRAFVLPLAAAMAGAALASPDPTREVIGAAVGLILGALGAALIGKLAEPRRGEAA